MLGRTIRQRVVLLAYQAMCGDVVRRLDGHLAQTTDDELVVYFGCPSAHEEDGSGLCDAGSMMEAHQKTIEPFENQIPLGRGVGAGPGRGAPQ